MIFITVPFFKKPRAHKAVKLHNLAVLISARNEKAVITQLIDSIAAQNYPQELITVFVLADNCTDNTAELARNAGAVVYERFNKERVGKGFALEYLFDQLKKDYPDDPFDAYFVFDADNVLDENYIGEMNKMLSDGYDISTSYRNSKNFSDNWITAGYGLWFLRESKYLNFSRYLCNTSCAVSGTGFMFSRRIAHKIGGWKFFLLTEDIEFTISNVIDGEKIGYCPTAVLYDEQPVTFKQSWNQRLRWAKGYLQVFQNYGRALITNVFRKKSFSCYDMSMTIMPAILLTTFTIVMNGSNAIITTLMGNNVLNALEPLAAQLGYSYILLYMVGLVTAITEWNNIIAKPYQKILYTFTFPIFMLTYIPISLTAMFKKVEWTPIEHNKSKTLADIRGMRKV